MFSCSHSRQVLEDSNSSRQRPITKSSSWKCFFFPWWMIPLAGSQVSNFLYSTVLEGGISSGKTTWTMYSSHFIWYQWYHALCIVTLLIPWKAIKGWYVTHYNVVIQKAEFRINELSYSIVEPEPLALVSRPLNTLISTSLPVYQ